MAWILLVLAYGIIKGLREILKKKALEKNTVIEVLFLYTFLSFVFVLPDARHAGGVEPSVLLAVAGKSFAIFLAWMFSFKAIQYMPVSFYGILDLSRVIFATLLGVIVLGEKMGSAQLLGLVLVLLGLLMLKLRKGPKGSGSEQIATGYVLMALASCILNAVSGLMDKLLMSDGRITDGQLQFWYMLFLVIYYLLYILVKRLQLNFRSAIKNYWIWLLAILFVVADRCLFIANAYPESRVTVMTLIKQSSVIVTIVCGKLVFKEKNIGYKLLCAGVVIAGIVISVLFK